MEVSDPPDVFSDDAELSSLRSTSSSRLFCDPCEEDGHYNEAEGYCVDCTHHLCQTCYQHHRTPRPTRHHTLIDKRQMPQTKAFTNECADKCSVHEYDILKYFCEDHQELVCNVCVALEHRSCNVNYIPTLAADLLNTQEYKSFKLAVESMVRNANYIQITANCNLKHAKKNAKEGLDKIRKFRKEIDSFFDELEKKISSKLTQTRDENQDRISEVLKENKIVTDKLNEIKKKLKVKEDKSQTCSLFVNIKQLDETIQELNKDIDTMEKNNKIQELTFKPCDSVTSFIRNTSEKFGSLVSFHDRSLPLDKLHVVKDIAVLSPERVALNTSYYNNGLLVSRMLIIDTQQMPPKVVTAMKMSSFTSCITRVGENQIAVAHKGNIYVYYVTDTFLLKNTIQNTELYHALVYTNDVFIGCTRLSPNRLRIVNMNGDFMKTLPIELSTHEWFYSSCSIAVTPDHTAIYVSDGSKKKVTCMTFEGELKEEYIPGGDWKPQCVAVSPDGLVYVSDSKNDVIHILTSDLKPCNVIMCTRYGIREPTGLALCDKERKLYVGTYNRSYISVFNI